MEPVDWKEALNIRIAADTCRRFGLQILLEELRKTESFRRLLGAEYMMSLRGAEEACRRLEELTDGWEDTFAESCSVIDEEEEPDPADWWKRSGS
jgi:hypothetical protein